MKHEIIIEPKDKQYCGKCNYKTMEPISSRGTQYRMWSCMLFQKILSSWDSSLGNEIARCGDCKILTRNFEKMPELEEA